MTERQLKRRIEQLESALEGAIACRHSITERCLDCKETAAKLFSSSTNRARKKRQGMHS